MGQENSPLLLLLQGLPTLVVHDRSAVEHHVCALHFAAADLRAQLEGARQRLADAEARAGAAHLLAADVGSMVLDAHERLRQERLEADRVAAATADAAKEAIKSLIAAARAEATASSDPVSARTEPAARVMRMSDLLAPTDARADRVAAV